jgi:hypothetical protein
MYIDGVETVFGQKGNITLVFKINANCFAENGDHNIGPRFCAAFTCAMTDNLFFLAASLSLCGSRFSLLEPGLHC